MYYNDIRYEFELTSGVWTNVAEHVIDADQGRIGIEGWGPLDRVASTGSFTFNLRNPNNIYTPGHINCLSNFEIGVKFRLVFELNDKVRTRFYGTVPVGGIEIDSSGWFIRTRVTVVDFMEQLANHELELPAFDQNKRIEQVVSLIVDNIPVQPQATEYNTGQDTFASVFDTTKFKTRAMQEIAKVVNTELGYVYIKQSINEGEVLTVEGRQKRMGAPLSQYSVWDEQIVPIVTEDGLEIITEDEKTIILEPLYDMADIILDNNFLDHDISHGKNYYNAVNAIAYPRRVDSAFKVLFNLERAIAIVDGESEVLKVGYRDPDQEAVSVAGIEMISPAATTDYLFNANSDGSGTDLTADLTVTATYGANGVEYDLENTGGSTGYVTKLQARGKGVYTYRPVEYGEDYAPGIAQDGKRSLNLNLIYQDNPLVAKDFAGVYRDLYSQKRRVVESVTMVANINSLMLNIFMDINIGDKIRVLINSQNIDSEYYIHSIRFVIAPGGIVVYTCGLSPAALVPSGYWLLGEVGSGELGETTVIGF